MADAPDSTPKAKTKICLFFKSKKGCKYGNKCRFLHPEKASNDIENIPQEGGKMIDNKKKSDHDTVIKTSPTAKTCRFFQSTRGCKFGNECQFLHAEKPPDKLGSISAEVGKLDGNHKQGDELKVRLKLSATPNNETQVEEKRMEAGKDSSDRQGIVCKFFKKKKGCLRGSKCPFAHVISGDGAILKPLAKEVLRKASKSTSRKQVPCQSNENAKPVTSIEQVTKQMELVNLQVDNDAKKHDRQASGQGIQLLNNTDKATKGTGMGLMDCNLECERLRSIEIQQLKRRFGGQGDYREIQENTSYKIKFKPTDPDWSFNIEAVYLTVSFPEDYPLHIFDAYLSEEQGLAEDIIKFANKKIQEWALNQEKISNDQGLLKLYFRPFLRWFDRNVESVFIDGGKEMRSKYVSSITSCSIIVPDLATGPRPVNEHVEDNGRESFSSSKQIDNKVVEINQNNEPSEHCQIFEKETGKQVQSFSNDMEHKTCNFKYTHIDIPQTSTSDTIDKNMSEINNLKQVDCMEGTSLTLSKQDANSKLGAVSEDTALSNQSELLCNDSVALSTIRKGTEIQLRGLNLEENVSTLRGSRVVFTLECNRCRQRIDQQLSVSGPVSKQCTRCASVFAVNYRPAIIHQFSSVLGYLDLDGCMPFDVVLPESELMLGCLHCSKETTVKGLQYGANRSWCSHCHAKLGFQIQSTRFQELQLSETATASLRKSKDSNTISKPKKQIRSSGIKEGQPLPANGTCKHYKKSFRWLRFPCCGKCYPCDLCHEEQEDHEMKYATRMVCGFCSREQPYTQQPCIGCKAAVTKSRSAHWEGGKGCRDKVTMSRNDEQKHRQSGKTVSRKAQKRSEGKGKGKGNKGK